MAQYSISKEEIAQRAFVISKEHKEYDQWIWLLAEAQLRLEMVNAPSQSQIRTLAQNIASQHPTIEILHWLLAEKRLLYEQKIAQGRHY